LQPRENHIRTAEDVAVVEIISDGRLNPVWPGASPQKPRGTRLFQYCTEVFANPNSPTGWTEPAPSWRTSLGLVGSRPRHYYAFH